MSWFSSFRATTGKVICSCAKSPHTEFNRGYQSSVLIHVHWKVSLPSFSTFRAPIPLPAYFSLYISHRDQNCCRSLYRCCDAGKDSFQGVSCLFTREARNSTLSATPYCFPNCIERDYEVRDVIGGPFNVCVVILRVYNTLGCEECKRCIFSWWSI